MKTQSADVAPYVGAWIEMLLNAVISPYSSVAPYVGAWIEIARIIWLASSSKVAPYVGAWIEICIASCKHALI